MKNPFRKKRNDSSGHGIVSGSLHTPNKTSAHFNPHESFINLKSVRWTILGSIGISASIAATIATNSSHAWDLSYEGFNHAVNIFRVPLGVLAATIPVIALMAATHRSEQTREQIFVTSLQNNFSNHYKHLEEFDKHIEKRSKTTVMEVERPNKLHAVLFPKSRSGDHTINTALVADIFNLVISIKNTMPRKKDEIDTIRIEVDNRISDAGLRIEANDLRKLIGVHQENPDLRIKVLIPLIEFLRTIIAGIEFDPNTSVDSSLLKLTYVNFQGDVDVEKLLEGY